MSQKSDTTPLSFTTYLEATERDVLPEGRPVLLGTFVKPDGIRALVRLSNSEIRSLERGERIGQAQILAIGEGYVDLGLMGQVHRLTIPGRP